uniref:Uncharacterized protein n=1 Tax=Caenorhabditis japonica TaxID=281687 RepID=A0A8R1IMP5_CAEJA
MGRAPLHTVAEQAQSFVMHQLGSSLHMISRYVVSNNRSTSCDCIVYCLLTNRKIELRTNVVEALLRIGDDPNDVPFIAGSDFSWSSSRFLFAVVEGVVQIRADSASTLFHITRKAYEEKIPVGASRKSVLAQQQCGVELGP